MNQEKSLSFKAEMLYANIICPVCGDRMGYLDGDNVDKRLLTCGNRHCELSNKLFTYTPKFIDITEFKVTE